MALTPTTGHPLRVGDKVRMNLAAFEHGDLDGVEVTASGMDYWRYMSEHPTEVYTVVSQNFETDDPSYFLDGPMAGNNWYADELIHLPAPANRFEIIKNMSLDEMTSDLLPLLMGILEDSMPSPELFRDYLERRFEDGEAFDG